MGDKLQYAAWGACAVLGLVAGVALGWAVWGRQEPRAGGQAPEQRQGDQSLVIARQPDQEPPAPPHRLPRGGTEERRVSVTVEPGTPVGQPGQPEAACGPVRVDLSLVRLEDGSARVVASSPDGRVTGGVDIPIGEPGNQLELAADHPWAAGVSYAGDQAWGVFLHRDLWRFRAGLEINATVDGDAEARATVGWTF